MIILVEEIGENDLEIVLKIKTRYDDSIICVDNEYIVKLVADKILVTHLKGHYEFDENLTPFGFYKQDLIDCTNVYRAITGVQVERLN